MISSTSAMLFGGQGYHIIFCSLPQTGPYVPSKLKRCNYPRNHSYSIQVGSYRSIRRHTFSKWSEIDVHRFSNPSQPAIVTANRLIHAPSFVKFCCIFSIFECDDQGQVRNTRITLNWDDILLVSLGKKTFCGGIDILTSSLRLLCFGRNFWTSFACDPRGFLIEDAHRSRHRDIIN